MHQEVFGVFTLFFVIVLIVAAVDRGLHRSTCPAGGIASRVASWFAWVGVGVSICMTVGMAGYPVIAVLVVVSATCAGAVTVLLCQLALRYPPRHR